MVDDHTTMDNLILVDGDGNNVKYCVNFLGFGQSRQVLNFDVTCFDSNRIQRGPENNVSVATNLHHVTEDVLAQRFLLDVLKDAAAGGVTKQDMKKLLTVLGFNVNIINGVNIDALIDKLKDVTKRDITEHSKPAYHERSVDGLYKLALFTARLLFLETGSLSKFSSYKVFEKGIWRACNAFVQAGGKWNGANTLLQIIANGFALQFQTPATTQDPASPCQSPYGQSMRCIQGIDWFNAMYGLMNAKLPGFEISIELLYDWCSGTEIDELLEHENTDDGNDNIEVQMGGTILAPSSRPSGHFVSCDAAHVTFTIEYTQRMKPPPKKTITSATGAVYSTVPRNCTNKPWSETSRQRLGKDFTPFLVGNTQNGNVFNESISKINANSGRLHPTEECIKNLQHIFGKEDGDCSQVHAILYYVIQLAVHWSRNSGKSFEDCFKNLMKEVMVVTCDRVVNYTCMCLKIPCTYTGSGDGKVYVYAPYNTEVSPEEQLQHELDLLKKNTTMDVENLMKFLRSQDKYLSTVSASNNTSIRYDQQLVPGTGHIPFPNNCNKQLKEVVSVKRDRLYIVSHFVSIIKEMIEQKINKDDMNFSEADIYTVRNMFALAYSITDLRVNETNVTSIYDLFSDGNSGRPTYNVVFTESLNSSYIETLSSKVIKTDSADMLLSPDYGEVANIVKEMVTDLVNALKSTNDKGVLFSLCLNFFKKLINLIFENKYNKCVITTQEPSRFTGTGQLTVYVLNSMTIAPSVFKKWTDEGQTNRPLRRLAAKIKASQGGGGRKMRKKIIQTGGGISENQLKEIIIEAAQETNLNVDDEKDEMLQDLEKIKGITEPQKKQGKSLLENLVISQTNPAILQYNLSMLSTFRSDRILEIQKILESMKSSSLSLSPLRGSQAQRGIASDNSNKKELLEIELKNHMNRLSKEHFITSRLEDEDTSEIYKEEYWKNRNILIPLVTNPTSLKIIENTVMASSDIEMLVCLYLAISISISKHSSNGVNSKHQFDMVYAYLTSLYQQLLTKLNNTYLPLTFITLEQDDISSLHTIIYNYTNARQRYYHSPEPLPFHVVKKVTTDTRQVIYYDTKTRRQYTDSIPSVDINNTVILVTKLLLYGETNNPEVIIPDNQRILVLFMCYLLLNEVFRNMIPKSFMDSYIKTIDNYKEIITLLEKSYTISCSIDPSNHTQAQIDAATAAPSTASVQQPDQRFAAAAANMFTSGNIKKMFIEFIQRNNAKCDIKQESLDLAKIINDINIHDTDFENITTLASKIADKISSQYSTIHTSDSTDVHKHYYHCILDHLTKFKEQLPQDLNNDGPGNDPYNDPFHVMITLLNHVSSDREYCRTLSRDTDRFFVSDGFALLRASCQETESHKMEPVERKKLQRENITALSEYIDKTINHICEVLKEQIEIIRRQADEAKRNADEKKAAADDAEERKKTLSKKIATAEEHVIVVSNEELTAAYNEAKAAHKALNEATSVLEELQKLEIFDPNKRFHTEKLFLPNPNKRSSDTTNNPVGYKKSMGLQPATEAKVVDVPAAAKEANVVEEAAEANVVEEAAAANVVAAAAVVNESDAVPAAAAKPTDAKKRPNSTEVDDAKEVVNDASHLLTRARTFYNQVLEIVNSISDKVSAAMKKWIPFPPVEMNFGTGMGGMNEGTLQQPIVKLYEARKKMTQVNNAAAKAADESVATALAASEAANTMNHANEAVNAANIAENASRKVTVQNIAMLEVATMFNHAADALKQLPESVLSYCTTAENCCRCLGQFLGNSKRYVVEYTRNGRVSELASKPPTVQSALLLSPDSLPVSVVGENSPERRSETPSVVLGYDSPSVSPSVSPRAVKEKKSDEMNQEGGRRRPTPKKSTRRKPRRHTRNYQSRNKRKHHSNKKSTIKHRKSYRKHNRTVKRRKSRRHH